MLLSVGTLQSGPSAMMVCQDGWLNDALRSARFPAIFNWRADGELRGECTLILTHGSET
jgi:hypothetical protein